MSRPANARGNARSVEDGRMQKCAWLIALSWALVLVLHRIPVGGYWLPIAGIVWLLLLAWVGLYLLSYFVVASTLSRRVSSRVESRERNPERLSAIIVLLASIAAVGALAVVYDFAFLRGYGFDTSVNQIRGEEVSQSYRGLSISSPVSGIGRLMIPAIFIALILAARWFEKVNPLARVILAGSSLVVLYEQIAFEGGRIMIAASVISTIFAFFFARPAARPDRQPRKARASKTPWIRLAALFAITLGFFLNVFAARILDRGGVFWSSYRSFASDFNLTVSVEQIARFEGVWGPFWFGLSMLWLYITQGISEFDLLISQSNIPHSYGLYQFPQITPISALILGANITYDFVRILPNTGTYLTIYGANWLDFGHGGAFAVAALLGAATALSVRQYGRGAWTGIALSGPMFFTVGVFAPVISVFPTIWPAFSYALFASVLLGRKGQTAAGRQR